MRCPKCGFISFDHMDTCLKCTKQMLEASSDLQGTTFNAVSPSFLSDYAEGDGQGQASVGDDGFDEVALSDPDLDTVLDTEDNESLGGELSLDELDIEGPGAEGDEEIEGFNDEMTMDLGQFEDEQEESDADPGQPADQLDIDLDQPADQLDIDLEMVGDDLDQVDNVSDDDSATFAEDFESLDDDLSFGEDVGAEEESLKMDVPEELTDITDLAAPEDGRKDFTSLEDDLEFDLDLSKTPSPSISAEEDIPDDQFSDVSLSEIDLSDAVDPEGLGRKNPSDPSNVDPDLDFDLDLHGITLPRKKG